MRCGGDEADMQYRRPPNLLIALAISPIRVVMFPDLSLKRGMTKEELISNLLI